MNDSWDIDMIKKFLPQRYPFLFIDKVLEVNRKEGKVRCLKNITVNECFFRGHFPEHPIVPGVIIQEALAQASIILYAALRPKPAAKRPDYYLGKVEIKFIKPVVVGDQLLLEVNKEKILDSAGSVKAVAKVNQQVVAKARLSFGVKKR